MQLLHTQEQQDSYANKTSCFQTRTETLGVSRLHGGAVYEKIFLMLYGVVLHLCPSANRGYILDITYHFMWLALLPCAVNNTAIPSPSNQPSPDPVISPGKIWSPTYGCVLHVYKSKSGRCLPIFSSPWAAVAQKLNVQTFTQRRIKELD